MRKFVMIAIATSHQSPYDDDVSNYKLPLLTKHCIYRNISSFIVLFIFISLRDTVVK